MEVQIISKKLIKPSIPTPSSFRNMSLSFVDSYIPPRTVPFVLYYQAHGKYHPDSVQHVGRLKRLENSLSKILTLFYPLAGRYDKENLLINCNDEGVEYSEALVNGKLSQILQQQFEIKELNRFLPDDQHQLQESATSPIVAVQINIFKCGGLALGLRISHRIIDGFTLSLFTNEWAKACKGGTENLIVPNFEAGVLFPSRATAEVKLPSPPITESEVVTRRFVFDAKTISKMIKAEAMSSCCDDNKQQISTTVVIALIWRAQINAARARHGLLRTSLLSVAVNLRGRTFRKIPENCCGNIFTWGTARFQADETKMGLNDFIAKVRDAIRNSILEFGTPKEDEDGFFSKQIMRPYIEIAEEVRKGEGDVHRFSILRNFPFYEVDFGWGKPAWVSLAQRPYKGVLVLNTKGGDGVEAWVTMDEQEMAFFQNDPSITIQMASPALPPKSRLHLVPFHCNKLINLLFCSIICLFCLLEYYELRNLKA